MTTLEENLAKLKEKTSATDKKKPEIGTQNWDLAKEMYDTFSYPARRAASQFNIGLAQMLGMPGSIVNATRSALGVEGEGIVPSGTDIQGKMADFGMTYEPGTEPDTILDRTAQNIGASAIPFVGLAAKGYGAAKLAATEFVSALGGASSGKVAQATEWGEKNPELARAFGELTGGVVSVSPGVVLKHLKTPGVVAYKLAKAPFSGPRAKARAVKEIEKRSTSPATALERFQKTTTEGLSPTQRTGDTGLYGLKKKIEDVEPDFNKLSAKQRSKATEGLKRKIVTKDGVNIEAARGYLNLKLRELGEVAKKQIKNIDPKASPEKYNEIVNSKLSQSLKEARRLEKKVWENIKSTDSVEPVHLKSVYSDELEDITAGGDLSEIDSFIKEKLGTTKRGKRIGGALVNKSKKKVTPKELHQFYSRLGRRVSELSEQAGKGKEIRIINNVREAALEDLSFTDVGDEYQAAITFSRELNEKFTRGPVGKALGFQRGVASEETMMMDKLLSGSDESARIGVEQLFKSTPGAKEDVMNLIKKKFAMSSIGEANTINRIKGTEFLKNNRRLLKAFPKLKQELQSAVTKQKKVDDLMGVKFESDISPLVKEQSAASVFLNSDPGDEINNILKYGRRKGKTRQAFSELKQKLSKDPTGDALRGTKNALADELITSSKMNLSDDITGEAFISGREFLKKLRRTKSDLLESGFLSKQEYENLEETGQTFKRVEDDLMAPKSEGKIMTDAPGQLLELIAGILGAKAGRTLNTGTIQAPGETAGFAKKLVNNITKDEARELIIKAQTDHKLMEDLLKDANKLTEMNKQSLLGRIKNKAGELTSGMQKRSAPVMAVTPPVVNITREDQQDEKLQSNLEKLRAKLNK